MWRIKCSSNYETLYFEMWKTLSQLNINIRELYNSELDSMSKDTRVDNVAAALDGAGAWFTEIQELLREIMDNDDPDWAPLNTIVWSYWMSLTNPIWFTEFEKRFSKVMIDCAPPHVKDVVIASLGKNVPDAVLDYQIIDFKG